MPRRQRRHTTTERGERRGTEPCTAQEIDRINIWATAKNETCKHKHAAFSDSRRWRRTSTSRATLTNRAILSGRAKRRQDKTREGRIPAAAAASRNAATCRTCDRNGISRQQRYVCTLLHCVPSIRPVRTFGSTTASGFRAVRKIPLPPNGPTTAACRKRFRNRTVPKTTAAAATAGE